MTLTFFIQRLQTFFLLIFVTFFYVFQYIFFNILTFFLLLWSCPRRSVFCCWAVDLITVSVPVFVRWMAKNNTAASVWPTKTRGKDAAERKRRERMSAWRRRERRTDLQRDTHQYSTRQRSMAWIVLFAMTLRRRRHHWTDGGQLLDASTPGIITDKRCPIQETARTTADAHDHAVLCYWIYGPIKLNATPQSVISESRLALLSRLN